MELSNIMVFAGKLLEKTETISVSSLTNFIAKDEIVGKIINSDDVAKAIDLLFTAGFIEIKRSDEINTIYQRYVPENLKKKFRRKVG